VESYITSNPLTQPVSRPLTADFIEPDLVLKTLDTIEGEWAEDDALRLAAPSPAVISSDCGDVADGPLPSFEAASVSPDVTGVALTRDKRGKAIVKKIMLLAQRRRSSTPPKTSTSVKPIRVARARAPRSPVAHGGTRRANSDSGGNEPPPRPWWHELAEDAYGRPIVDGLVIQDGRWSQPHLQMTDHNLPGYGGGRPLYPGEPCHCDRCKSARPARRARAGKQRMAS
jgi:hypothetical protein